MLSSRYFFKKGEGDIYELYKNSFTSFELKPRKKYYKI